MDFDQLYYETSSSVASAAREGNAVLLKSLISEGRSVRSTDNRGWSPLHEAAAMCHYYCVGPLVEAGIDVNALNHTRQTPLILACKATAEHISKEDQLTTIKELLSLGADPNFPNDDPWESPINLCLKFKNLEAVCMLIEGNADINMSDASEGPPLVFAASLADHDAVSLLLSKGCSLKAKNEQEMTALHMLMLSRIPTLECLNLLLDHPECNPDFINSQIEDGATALLLALQKDFREGALALLDNGADPNTACSDCTLPLHTAVQFCNDLSIFKRLLERTHMKSIEISRLSQPIFHLAIECKRFDVLKELLLLEFNIDDFVLFELPHMEFYFDCIGYKFRQSGRVNTPLTFLLTQPFFEEAPYIANLFINKGCSVEPISNDHIPPVMAALTQKDSFTDKSIGGKILTLLFKHGLNLNNRYHFEEQLPAIFIFAFCWNPPAFRWLLKYGFKLTKYFTNVIVRDYILLLSEVGLVYRDYISQNILDCLHFIHHFTGAISQHEAVIFFHCFEEEIMGKDAMVAKLESLKEKADIPLALQTLCVNRIRDIMASQASSGLPDINSRLETLVEKLKLPSLILDMLSHKNCCC